VWFKTLGGGFYGGINGIPATFSNVSLPLDEGVDAIARGVITGIWRNKYDPPRDYYNV
jgi:hypothetical protein